MAIISQQQLFVWSEMEELGDLERLMLVLDNLPDEKIVRALEKLRDKGTDKYPVRPTWNSLLAGIVYDHASVESLRRELKRNGQLRQISGFNMFFGIKAVPTSWAYSRFMKNIFEVSDLVEEMFNELVAEIKELLPGFGKILAFDGKAIDSAANGKNKGDEKKNKPDNRRDDDADWGKKVYKGKKEDGTLWQKIKSWFGYKLHLIVDAQYELPVAYEVTKASKAEGPEMRKLFEKMEKVQKEILKDCEFGLGDRGYDDVKNIEELWKKYSIKPVIDIRNCWKDGEETKTLSIDKWNVVYNYKGDVFCICPETGKQREMGYGGFEKDRESLKYRCPAKQYGIECAGACKCTVNGAIRIPLSYDPRIFTPLARSSYTWDNLYKMRTSVERVNSRLDVSFGFERHFIRGLKKMKVRVGLALCVMLAMALGRIKEKRKDLMRSLVKTA